LSESRNSPEWIAEASRTIAAQMVGDIHAEQV
jgi:hypothetical protein